MTETPAHLDRTSRPLPPRSATRGLGALLYLWLLVASTAFAQSEQALREAFEGTTVTVKIEMPATSTGIDVRPDTKPPIDFARLGDLMKREGTSVHAGQRILVTKVKVKRDLIEFQLGGGGYGTFGDELNGPPTSNAPQQGKSAREKQLEDQIRGATDPAKRKALERELKDERHERERENARSAAEANQANQLREANVQQKKLYSGSRFNLRFRNGVPAEYLTPDGVRRALASWVEFDDDDTPASDPAEVTDASPLRKGLLLPEVERIFGPAVTASEKREGSLLVQERTYRRGAERIVTKFVYEVLVEYSITSK